MRVGRGGCGIGGSGGSGGKGGSGGGNGGSGGSGGSGTASTQYSCTTTVFLEFVWCDAEGGAAVHRFIAHDGSRTSGVPTSRPGFVHQIAVVALHPH
jgi:hypothetical protein